jgi:small ligand-binding sensory domain FIST
MVKQSTLTSRIAAGLSTVPAAAEAAAEAAREAAVGLEGRETDLAFLFLSSVHLDGAAEAAAAVAGELAPRALLGCVADGVLAQGRELEEGPAAAVWAGSLPDATVGSFHLAPLETEDGLAVAGFPAVHDPALVALLVDPFSFPISVFLQGLNEDHPGLPLVGGIASGAGRPGTQALILGDEVLDEGAVGVTVDGVAVRTVVSQGCAPFGRESVITRAEGNVIHELAGERAFDRLRADLVALPPAEQRQVAEGILAGLVIDENKSAYGRGDYLMRGLLGADEASGSIAVGEQVRVGQTLRFHFRDATSADRDLREALERELGAAPAAGALLFSCNGRGTNMFPQPDHDARTVAEALGGPAVAGFFCGGEIGPVGGKAFLHGFTATLAVFLGS